MAIAMCLCGLVRGPPVLSAGGFEGVRGLSAKWVAGQAHPLQGLPHLLYVRPGPSLDLTLLAPPKQRRAHEVSENLISMILKSTPHCA